MAKGITVDLIVDPKGAIEGLGKVESKSTSVAGVMGKLGGVAAAGLVALGTAALGAVTGLVAATKSAGEYAENVELAASKTHLSTEAVQELQYASKITGVDFETISGSLTKLTKSVGQAAGGNKKTAAAFDQLGVSTVDANGNLRDSTDIYSDVISALGQVSNPTERDIIAMQLLGKSATNLNPLIDGTAGSLTDLSAQAHDAGAVLGDDMISKLGSVDDAFDKLGAGVDAAKNALGLTLMPILQELGDQGSGLLGEFTNAVISADGDLSKAAPAIGAVFGKAASFLLEQIPMFLEVGTSIISSILEGVAAQGPDLITAAIPVLAGFVTTLLGQLPMLLDAGLKIVIALVQGVAAALPTLIPAAIQAVVGLVGALIQNLPLLLDAGLQLITGLGAGLIAALPTLIAQLPVLIMGLVNFLISAIPQIITTGVQLLVALVGALPTIIDGIVSALPQIIVGITTAIIGAIPQLTVAGIQLLVGLIAALPQIIVSLVKAVPQIISGLVKAFSSPSTLAQFAKVGGDLIRGLWKGINDTKTWIWNQISGFVSGITQAVRNFFGIASPSTVFAEIGQFLVRGLAVGLSDTAPVDAALSSLSSQVTDGFQGSLSVDARGTVAAGAGVMGSGTVIQVTLPVTNSFVGTPDQFARYATKTIRDGLRNGSVPADWNQK